MDIVFGDISNQSAVRDLVEALKSLDLSGTLYIGYPLIGTLDGPVKLDAVLTSLEKGVVGFDFGYEVEDLNITQNLGGLSEVQNDIFVLLENNFKSTKELRAGRDLKFEINIISLTPGAKINKKLESGFVSSADQVGTIIKTFKPINKDELIVINGVIQRTLKMKPFKKRDQVSSSDSKGYILKLIEKEIANLDAWQKKAAIEFPEGPQRIRGLAGSGKTIVLALKASYLHATYPEWTIAVTFQTRTLYQQFKNFISKFYHHYFSEEPDWNRLKILHAWGGPSQPGLYYEVSKAANIEPLNFSTARHRFGYENAFGGVCRTFLDKGKHSEIFDVVLIDEAQDFPQSFFELVFKTTKDPKRIVWAYDDLQNLRDYSIPLTDDLFGRDARGKPRVSLKNIEGQPQQDIVLPVCYRNTSWALTVAHSLGFGIYREESMVQMFDTPKLWVEIGYEVKSGSLGFGRKVSLERSPNSTPKYFKDLMNYEDAVIFKGFDKKESEFKWVAESIKKNLDQDELEHDDILIICCNPREVKKHAASLMKALDVVGLDSHHAGVTASLDAVFFDNSIAITSIYRAKGNEAPMVYVVGADYCFEGYDLPRKRNILFTGITRSRGWVRVSGLGPNFNYLREEALKVFENNFQLEFKFPTKNELETIKSIHRDIKEDDWKDLDTLRLPLLNN